MSARGQSRKPRTFLPPQTPIQRQFRGKFFKRHRNEQGDLGTSSQSGGPRALSWDQEMPRGPSFSQRRQEVGSCLGTPALLRGLSRGMLLSCRHQNRESKKQESCFSKQSADSMQSLSKPQRQNSFFKSSNIYAATKEL